MLKNLFKRCSHEYKLVGEIPVIIHYSGETRNVSCYFLECRNCGKRIVLKENNSNYPSSFLSMINLWIKCQYKMSFKSYQDEVISCINSSSSDKERYKLILREIQEEVKKFSLPTHDSENRLIVNNIKVLLGSALTEECWRRKFDKF